MILTPIFTASPVIQLHLFAALIALGLGAVQLSARKGGGQHHWRGYSWVGLMAVVAASSFFIYEIRLWGLFSPIHLLSLFTLVSLYMAVQAARRKQAKRHFVMMLALNCFALLLTGAFTLLPGRLLHQLIILNL